MAVNNNTTSLGGDENGTIGTRNFNDYSAKEISVEISRHNYRSQVKSDKELNEFRQIVYKMVSGWTREDKIAQITEYGDASMLQKYSNPSEDTINKILTESIIIHLDPADLRKLRSDMMKKAQKVRMGIQKAEKNRNSAVRKMIKGFNTETFADAYERVKGSRNPKEFKKALSSVDASYRVPKYIENQYKNLRKEIEDVLRTCFNKVEITAIAYNMGIETPSGITLKEIIRFIINKVCLYVDLIVGKGKANFGNAILNPEPYDNILQYTSYSYVTGKPGIDPSEWAERKREARRAKEAIKERAKMQRPNKFKGNGRLMASITNGNTARSLSGLARKLKNNDTGVLADLSYEELATLAGKYGIDPTALRNKNIGVLKAKIYNGMRNEATRVNKLERKKSVLNKKGIAGTKSRKIDDLLSVHRDKDGGDGGGGGGVDIPVVEFTMSGNLKTRNILKAVPVYIIGQGLAGTMSKADAEKLEKDPESSLKDNSGLVSMLNKKRKGKNKIDTSITSTSKLSDAELRAFNYILTLNYGPRIVSSKNSRLTTPQSLLQLEMELMANGIPGRLIDKAKAEAGFDNSMFNEATDPSGLTIDSKIIFQLQLRYAFLYAFYKKWKKLMDYLTNTYGIVFDLSGLEKFGKGLGKIGKGIGTALSIIVFPVGLGIAIGKGIAKLVGRIGDLRADLRKPTSKSQLPDKARKEYDSLANLSISQLKTYVNQLGYDNAPITAVVSEKFLNHKGKAYDIPGFYSSILGSDQDKIDNFKKSFLRAVVARHKTERALEFLYLYEAGIRDENGVIVHKEMYKVFTEACRKSGLAKLAHIGRAFIRVGKAIKNFFTKKTGVMDGGTAVTSPEELAKERLGDGTDDRRLFLPKVDYLGKKKVDETKIKEVLPVYVVNMIDEIDGGGGGGGSTGGYNPLPYGSGGKNAKGKGITNSELSLIDYGRKFGMGSVDGELIKLKDPADKSVANEADSFVGRSAKESSRFPKNGFYKPTKATIAWAINNNKQFATGGYSFSDTYITGDARGNNIFSGGAKPELVQTFSKSPIVSKITPIKKYANGGFSVSEWKNTNMEAYGGIHKDLEAEQQMLANAQALGAKVGGRTMKKLNKEMDKVKEIMNQIQMRSNIAQAIQQMGGEVPADLMNIKEKSLVKILSKTIRNYMKERKKGKAPSRASSSGKLSNDANSAGIKEIDSSKKAMPVFVTNEYANGRELFNSLDTINSSITGNFSTLMTGLGSGFQLVAPYGVGAGFFSGLIGTGVASNIATMAADAMATAAHAGLDIMG